MRSHVGSKLQSLFLGDDCPFLILLLLCWKQDQVIGGVRKKIKIKVWSRLDIWEWIFDTCLPGCLYGTVYNGIKRQIK